MTPQLSFATIQARSAAVTTRHAKSSTAFERKFATQAASPSHHSFGRGVMDQGGERVGGDMKAVNILIVSNDG